VKVGVLALQGDFEAHARVLSRIGAEPIEVRTPLELASADALILPGGESTTIRKLAENHRLIEPIRESARSGMPVFGTCAGMIACARTIVGEEEPIFGLVDIDVHRNAYGRQVQSFEADIDVSGIGSMRAVFIRAPRIERVGAGVEVLARHDDEAVVVREGSIMLAAFHPELTDDDRLHRLFVSML
jgi:pyridoxal 5'-phosphate synthase pdxT subunit